MREIKFRGFYFRKKDVLYPEEKKWVYGSLIIDDRGYWIKVGNHSYLVPKESVGQFTGLKDSKRTKEYPEGQEIYERDIIKESFDKEGIIKEHPHYKHYVTGERNTIKRYESKIHVVEWINEPIVDGNDYGGSYYFGSYSIPTLGQYNIPSIIEVIGNVHDNPEMLTED